jgi:hypothetical protein
MRVLCKLVAPFQVLLLIDELAFCVDAIGASDGENSPIDGLDGNPSLLLAWSLLRRPPWLLLLLLASCEPFDDLFLFGATVGGGVNEGKVVKTFGETGTSSLLRRLPFEAFEELVFLAPIGPVRLSIWQKRPGELSLLNLGVAT